MISEPAPPIIVPIQLSDLNIRPKPEMKSRIQLIARAQWTNLSKTLFMSYSNDTE